MTIIDADISFNNITNHELAEGDGVTIAAKISIQAPPALKMPLGRLMSKTNKVWRDLEGFFHRRQEPSFINAYRIVNDLTLTIAARPAADWREAKKKVVFLAEHRNAIRLKEPSFAAILDAAVEIECERWDILLIDMLPQEHVESEH